MQAIFIIAILLAVAIIFQYVRALQLRATVWWTIIPFVFGLIAVPFMFLYMSAALFGRGVMVIGPIAVTISYMLIAAIALIHYSLRIKRAKPEDLEDVLDR